MNGRKAKVAVIIPCYNMEKYLAFCLDSCISQTLYDIEIICVDDGSTDGTVAILEQFAAADPRIQIINQKNRGVSAARNAGLRAANSELIMFLDSDDYLSENTCERLWCESREAPTDIINFCANIFPDKPRADSWIYYNLTGVAPHRFWRFEPGVLFREKSATPFVWRQAFRKEFLDACGVTFDERLSLGEDTTFLMQLYPQGQNFSFLPDRLYHYRWYREDSAMAKANADLDVKIQQHLLVEERVCAYWRQQGWLECYGQDLVEWMLDFVVPEARSGKVKQPDILLRQLRKLISDYDLEKYLRYVRPTLRSAARAVKRT